MKPITPNTAVLAVFGDPVSQSLSPLMHNGWIEDHGLDAVYVALPLKTSDPVAAFKALKALGLKGANVTVPYKEAAAMAADRAEARAVNTLCWNGDGSVSGFNTDGLGFLDSLDEATPDWRERVERVLILGAGGVAFGIARALSGRADVVITNRTAARAHQLAAEVPNTRTAPWQQLPDLFARADLVVQTTTLGMSGNPSPDWPVLGCATSMIVADIVYKPLETPLLAAARARGLACVDGLGMLIHQGAHGFEHWFGIRPDPKIARQRLLAALRP
jgi:shikimate dehydrogenase